MQDGVGEGPDVVLRPILTEETARQLIELGLRNEPDEVRQRVSDAVISVYRGKGAIGLHERLVAQATDAVKARIGFERESALHVESIAGFKRQVRTIMRTLFTQNNQIRVLEEEKHKDPLTGLDNKGGFEEVIPKAIEIALGATLEAPNDVSVLFIDIDNFGNFNNHYGHLHGDAVLKGVAGVIKEIAKRESDFVCRFGGEEFVVALFGCKQEDALRIAEVIRVAVESAKFKFEGENHRVTISIGAGSMSLHEEIDMDARSTTNELLTIADTLMYQSKGNGRNKVTGMADLDSKLFQRNRAEAARNVGEPNGASSEILDQADDVDVEFETA